MFKAQGTHNDLLTLLAQQCPEIPDMLAHIQPFYCHTASVQPVQAALLYVLARQYDGESMVELGTRRGYSGAALALAVPQGTLYTIDVNPLVTASGWPGNIRQIVGYTWDEAALFKDDSISLIFVDADHAQATRDVEAWWPKLRDGGLMLFHDYSEGYPNVFEAVAMLTDDPPILMVDDTGVGLAGVYKG